MLFKEISYVSIENSMRPLTHHSFILTILLLTSMGYIGFAGVQTTLLDLSSKSELAEGSTSSNDTASIYEYKDNWVLVNHDLYGSRTSNQTTIGKDNVEKLQVKWRWLNEYEIQDPPIINEGKGYVQDYAGNVIAFDARTGHTIWSVDAGGGPTMGLAYDSDIIFASTATNATIIAINSSDGKKLWESELLGDPKVGYSIDAFPIVWGDYVIAGSGGSGLPPGPGLVKGNITSLNRTTGEIIWNLETTAGEWIEQGKTPPNGGATAWSGGSLDPDTGILYIPLGSASPNFNASTRQTPNLYSNHMIAVNITNGKLIWATPFVAHGTVLEVTVPDSHDWDTSWGSSITRVTMPNGTERKIVIGHDKMGNVIAMDARTGQELWWKTLGEQYRTDIAPSPKGSGMVWSYGVYNYHAVDNGTLYISATNRGLNYFTDGISGHKISAPNSIEQGLVNGTIMALDISTGEIKWQIQTKYPPRVSPLVTNDILFAGYIPFAKNLKTGVILALDKETGDILWESNVNAPIAPVGPSVGNGMLFVPTGRIQDLPKEGPIQGSIVAFGLPSKLA